MKYFMPLLILILSGCVAVEEGICVQQESWNGIYKIIITGKRKTILKVVKAPIRVFTGETDRKVNDEIVWDKVRKGNNIRNFDKVPCPDGTTRAVKEY